jgi:DNA invertase Pin-like site-specific DNA recombinase
MLVGFARTSTTHQKYSLEAQIESLTQAGCEKIFSEEVSAVASQRPQFDAAMEFVRDGDTLVVCSLSRFARSIRDLTKQVDILDSKNVSLKVLDIALDTSTPTGKLMLNLLGSINQFELQLLHERQRVGIEKAKAAGKFKGRAASARAKTEKIQELLATGMKPAQVAKQLSIGVASVYRYRT